MWKRSSKSSGPCLPNCKEVPKVEGIVQKAAKIENPRKDEDKKDHK